MTMPDPTTQLGGTIACDGDTTDAAGDAGSTGVGITTQVGGPLACGALPNSLTPPTTGTLTKPSLCDQTLYRCVDPTRPLPIEAFSWSISSAVGTCCDIDWSGDNIIVGNNQFNFDTELNYGHAYVTTNRGASWTEVPTPDVGYLFVTITSDGQKLGAYSEPNSYVSSDSGATWVASTAPYGDSNPVVKLVISDDGSLAVYGWTVVGAFNTSTDNGLNWTETIPSTPYPLSGLFYTGGISSDGGILYAGYQASSYGGYTTYNHIVKSTDYGATWSITGSVDATYYPYLACSGNGQYVLASAQNYAGYFSYRVSSDYGATWTTFGEAPGYEALYTICSVSTDGSVMAIINYFAGKLLVSTDCGATWEQQGPIGAWSDVAINYDGTVIVATQWNGTVYIATAN